MMSLEAWYRDVTFASATQSWMSCIEELGFERVAARPELEVRNMITSWDFIKMKGEPVFFGVSERIDNHVAVECSSKSDDPATFEVALLKFLRADRYPYPVETVLIRGDSEECGPLMTLRSAGSYASIVDIARIVHDNDPEAEIPQIRIIQTDLPGMETPVYSTAPYLSRVIGKSLWIDFAWSTFSPTWSLDVVAARLAR